MDCPVRMLMLFPGSCGAIVQHRDIVIGEKARQVGAIILSRLEGCSMFEI